MIEIAEKYISDVLSGKEMACRLTILAYQRHVDDLKNKKEFYFDKESAKRTLAFFPYLKHYKGKWAGDSFVLAPWQAAVIYVVFGWKRIDNHKRRFRTVNIEVPRKGGKTTFIAAIALYLFIADGEEGAEVYTAATTREQAKIAFTDARQMVLRSPDLNKRVEVLTRNMNITKSAAKFEYVSSDYDTLDGLNPTVAVLDEVHAYKTNGIYGIFASAFGSREQPMMLIITTAGFRKEWWYYKVQRRSIIEILEGKIVDDSVFGVIYTLDEGDDWQDPEVWKKANPNLGVTPSIEYLEGRVRDALNKPSERVNVLTKHFNIFTDASDVWIPSEKWEALSTVAPHLVGKKAYGGLDLANTRDIAAYSLCIPIDDENVYLKRFFFVPLESARDRQEASGVPYLDWINEGWLIGTEGNSIDYNYIKKVIFDYAKEVSLHSIAIDRWNSTHFRQELEDELGQMYVEYNGKMQYVSKVNNFGQGFKDMSDPTKLYETMILEKHISHDGNPISAWMLGNVELQRDPAGNIKPDKGKSSEKIDGVVSDIMALGEWTMWRNLPNGGKSKYEGKEILMY